MVADVVVSSIKSFPEATSLALVSDLQFNEPYSSAALNRKFRGIVNTGFYGGFLPSPAGGLNLKISSGEEGGTASIDIDKYYQLTVRQQADVTMPVTAGKKVIVVLEATYALGQETYQVNCNSAVQAVEIKFLEEGTALRQNQLELCTVTVPAGATELTEEMIDVSRRRNQTVGIMLSSEIDSDADHIAASSHAVKKAVKAARDETEKQIEELVDGAPASLDTLKKIANAINNDPDFFNTLTAILKLKAPLESPALTGIPTVPTPPLSVSNKQVANTEYVQAAVAALVGSSPEALDTLAELAEALGNDPNFATTMLNKLAGKQPLDGTLTNLSGKDVPALLQYLGLVETINLAAGAVPSTRKINGHALAADTNVTAQDIFNGQAIGIDAGQNLNDFKTAGLYFQGMNVNTSSALNYPENNAGALIVLRSAGITQIYYVYNSSRIWSRSQYSNGGWTPWAREYNTQNKPGAADVGALPITGGALNGSLGIGVANALGGNSIVLGDNDTGFKQEGDGILNVYANSALVMRFISSLIESLKPLKVNGNCIATGEIQAGNGAVRLAADGNVYGTMWGGWLRDYLAATFQPKGNFTPAGQAYTKAESDARYIQSMRLGSAISTTWWGDGGDCPAGHVLTGGDFNNDKSYVRYKPVQVLINGQWVTISG